MADGAILGRGHVAAPRARGRLRLSVAGDARGARIAGLHQAGCLRLLFPDTGDAALTAIALNTAGGLTGGDDLAFEAVVADGRLVLSTQAAERIYRADAGQVAAVETRLRIEPGARLDWLPQETILFQDSALERVLNVDMAADATLLAVEPLLLGRLAMGERLSRAHLRDRIRVRRDGRLILADAVHLSGDIAARIRGPATLGGGAAMATVLLVSPGAEAPLSAARALLPGDGPAVGGASLVAPGVLLARIVGQDGFDLRRVLIPLLELLGQRNLPRTWVL